MAKTNKKRRTKRERSDAAYFASMVRWAVYYRKKRGVKRRTEWTWGWRAIVEERGL